MRITSHKLLFYFFKQICIHIHLWGLKPFFLEWTTDWMVYFSPSLEEWKFYIPSVPFIFFSNNDEILPFRTFYIIHCNISTAFKLIKTITAQSYWSFTICLLRNYEAFSLVVILQRLFLLWKENHAAEGLYKRKRRSLLIA